MKRILYSTTLAALLFAGGCKKEKFDINSNPDDVTEASVSPTVLLPGAQQATASLIVRNWNFAQQWMGFWARSGSYQSDSEIDAYQLTSSSDIVQPVWNDLYTNANNYHLMQKKAEASGQGFYDAIGRIMRSHNFQILVDIYNNVPYFEAFNGTKNPTPKFDKGIDIYNDIFKQLDTAITLLHGPTADVAANPEIEDVDLMYHGDAEGWIRFANTLRLRMLVHLHNGLTTPGQVVTGVNIAEQVGKITSEGFIDAAHEASVNPGFSGSKPQPYYRFYNTNENGTTSRADNVRASEFAIQYYGGNADLRRNRFYVAPSGAPHKGIPFGTPSGDQTLLGSLLSTVRGPGLSPDGAASDAWIFTSVESLFLQAEARERGILTTGPTAKELLMAAVRESFVWLGLTASQANDYMSNNAGYEDVDYDQSVATNGNGLYTILSQKWFALNTLAPYEVWTDYRRTDIVYGVPAGLAGPTLSVDPGSTATRVPRRLLYPQSEYNYNATNVAQEGSINIFNSKIFWDLN